MKTFTSRVPKAISSGFALVMLAFVLPTLSAPFALAQSPAQSAQQEEVATQQSSKVPNDPAALLTQLNLSSEQITQMQEIQSQSAPEARMISRRLNQARRALDEAIYADTPDESLIGQRAREVAEAQAALVALRARTELRVRLILTPAQLQTFRDLRLEARRNQRIQRQLNRGNNPNLQNRLNLRPAAPPEQTPNARPLNRLRERRRSALRRP